MYFGPTITNVLRPIAMTTVFEIGVLFNIIGRNGTVQETPRRSPDRKYAISIFAKAFSKRINKSLKRHPFWPLSNEHE
jgi:hypothetical protein